MDGDGIPVMEAESDAFRFLGFGGLGCCDCCGWGCGGGSDGDCGPAKKSAAGAPRGSCGIYAGWVVDDGAEVPAGDCGGWRLEASHGLAW